jgi:uncharacterized protein YneF (UPF0154 family)
MILQYIKITGLIIFITFAICGLSCGAWWLRREINYNLMYKPLIQKEIRNMVKPEALR